MGRCLRKCITSVGESETEVSPALGAGGTMAMPPAPGARRRKLWESGEFQISYMQLRSRTLLRSPESNKRRRPSSSVPAGDDLECRNPELGMVLSRCSSDDMPGEVVVGAVAGEAAKEECSRSGWPEEEAVEGEEVHEGMGTATSGEEEERRRTREGTPVSELRRRVRDESGDLESTASPAAAPSNPGRRSVSGRATRTMPTPMPSEGDIDAFFSAAEKEQAKRFAERYNYDVAKDAPLEGRYEWVRLKP